ncbi:type IV pilin [Thiohalobacter sp. COW1]|uniref:TfP pilus assembly protein PilW n=2 Tax=Thiohalobacteraceae TaxID=3085110 RepID=A0A1Z4VNV1_9GAMM|nr:TfP pilus assembly protein PilW [Thiohalobacter thiocyanaticus]BCO31642.1 type IV pilin [Thiohalobacter sp. COW1]
MHARHTSIPGREAGITMIEIMVALTVSLILAAGVMQIFISSKSTYHMQTESARLQENGRFAAEFMARDIRMAGYTGCASRPNDETTPSDRVTNTLNSSNQLAYNFTVGIEGFNDVSSAPTYLSAAGITPVSGSDVVIVRRSSDAGVRVSQNNNGGQVFVEHKSTQSGACSGGSDMLSGLCVNDIVMVSDCQKSRIFQITPTITATGNELNLTHVSSGSPGNAIASWGGASAPEEEQFGPGSEIIKIVTYAYYIANNADGIPSLYRTEGTAATTLELIEGVEDMQVEYGEDTIGEIDGVADVYRTANAVVDWERVVSVRLYLMLRSDSPNVTDGAQPVLFNNTTVTPAASDRYLRRVLTKTIALRNRTS